MESPILSSPMVLLQLICVVIVVAALPTESSIFSGVSEGHLTVKIRSILIPMSGALTVTRSR